MAASGMPRGRIPLLGLSMVALSLLLGVSGARAQSDTATKHQPSSSTKGVGTRALGAYPKDTQARMTAWYKDCRKGWDAKTHMSKKDYDRTCRRMAEERIKFLKDDEKARTRSK
jgi:hypothetical protein